MIKSIGIFCGSSEGADLAYREAAIEIGKLLANYKITTVYGAGNIGLMGHLADSVLENHGTIIGVIPELLTGREIMHDNLSELHIVDSMASRKTLIIEMSDAFIAMPGGFGTFDELMEVLTHYQLEISSKPCGILNIKGYFNHFIQQIDFAVQEKFLRIEHRQNLIIDERPDVLLKKILDFEPVIIDKNWVTQLKEKNTY